MRNIVIILSCVFLTQMAYGQFNMGFKFGANTTDIGIDDIVVPGASEQSSLDLAIAKAHYGFNFGGFIQIQTGWFLIQPEVVFNSTKVDFSASDNLGFITEKILTDSYQNLDIPLLLGMKAGPLRIQAGPVGHIPLKYVSELKTLNGFSSDFSPIEYGFQAGIGIDFFNIMIDFRYEGNFNKFGDYITFHGDRYKFSTSPTRLLLSMAVGLF